MVDVDEVTHVKSPKSKKDQFFARTRGSKHKKAKAQRTKADESDIQQLWGLHTVEAALKNPRREVLRLIASENAWRRLSETGSYTIKPELVHPREIDKLLPESAVHQGLLLEAKPLEPLSLEELPHGGLFLALDQITDPHNVGAILRSAAAFNVAAMIVPQRHSAEATGVMAKAASGALDLVPFCVVRNLRETILDLRKRGVMCVALDSEGPKDLTELKLKAPLLLVLGAEGRGVRQGVGEACDALARLDMPGKLKSLNVSNAAALSLFVAAKGI